jgi:hypothetical protein
LLFSAKELDKAKKESGLRLEPLAQRLSYSHTAAMGLLKHIIASQDEGWTEDLKEKAQKIVDGGHHKSATAFLRAFNYKIDRRSKQYTVDPDERLAKIKYWDGRQTAWIPVPDSIPLVDAVVSDESVPHLTDPWVEDNQEEEIGQPPPH